MPKPFILFPLFFLLRIPSFPQPYPDLNTAKDSKYMKPIEREMVKEMAKWLKSEMAKESTKYEDSNF